MALSVLATSSQGNNLGATGISSVTLPPGTKLLVVAIARRVTNVTVPSASYDSAALTQVGDDLTGSATRLSFHTLANPTTASARDLLYTLSGETANVAGYWAIGADGTPQVKSGSIVTTSGSTSGGGSNTTLTLPVPSSEGELVLGAVAIQRLDDVDPLQTDDWGDTGLGASGGGHVQGFGARAGGSVSASLGWTIVAGSSSRGGVGMALVIEEIGGGPGPSPGSVEVTHGFTTGAAVYGINIVSFSPASTTNPHVVIRADDVDGEPGSTWVPIAEVPATSAPSVTRTDYTAEGGRRYHYSAHERIGAGLGPAYTPASIVTPSVAGAGTTVVVTAGGGAEASEEWSAGAGATVSITAGGGAVKVSEVTREPAFLRSAGLTDHHGPGILGATAARAYNGVLRQDEEGFWIIDDEGAPDGYLVLDPEGFPAASETLTGPTLRIQRLAGAPYQVF